MKAMFWQVRIMLSLLSVLVVAFIMGAIALTSDLTVSSPLQIGFFWVVAAVFGFSGLSTMANDETGVGMFFGLVGNWKISGIWSIFMAAIYFGLSILFFWVPFFAE